MQSCPGCKKDILKCKDFVEMTIDGQYDIWCPTCAKKHFKYSEIRKARQYAKQCENRNKEPIKVLATLIELSHSDYECPNCLHFINKKTQDRIYMSISDGGYDCGLCHFFLPDLTDVVYGPLGNLWPNSKRRGGI